jgi:hypothetical protein
MLDRSHVPSRRFVRSLDGHVVPARRPLTHSIAWTLREHRARGRGRSGRCAAFVFVSFRPVSIDFPLQRAKQAVERRLGGPRSTRSCSAREVHGRLVRRSAGSTRRKGARRCSEAGERRHVDRCPRRREDRGPLCARRGPRSGAVELGGPEALSQREVVTASSRRSVPRSSSTRYRRRSSSSGERRPGTPFRSRSPR